MADLSNGHANLHLHTVFSDGELRPADVVRAHARAGFAAIALTDHDTLAGVDALGDLQGWGVRILSGVELSIEDEPDRGLIEAHLLGYAFDLDDASMRLRLRLASEERETQKRETVRLLAEAGYPVDWEAVRRRALGNVGKPHIVAAAEAANPQVSREELYAVMGPGGRAHVGRAQDLRLDDAVALVPAGLDHLQFRVSQLPLQMLAPARLQEPIVRCPEDEGGNVELIDVARPADQVAVVERPGRPQVGSPAGHVVEWSDPFVHQLISHAVGCGDAGFESLTQPGAQVKPDHDLVPGGLL